jgi:peptide/nickel transport system permease protein
MIQYIIRRILYIIPLVFFISVISFLVIQAPPGDFVTSQMMELEDAYGSEAELQAQALRLRYGLDKPVYIQYFKWIWGILTRLDFGFSFVLSRPVSHAIATRLPYTILITGLTVIFQFAVAIPIGVYSAVKQYSVGDYVFTFVAFIGRSIPNFFLALVLMYIMFEFFGWSVGGLYSPEYERAAWSLGKAFDLAKHLILPVIVVGTASTAGTVRVLRATLLDELRKLYVQVARTKGVAENKLIFKYPTRIALLPIISTLGWTLPRLVSGAIITSIVLNLPTTGSLLYQALLQQDMYLAGSFILMLSTLTFIGTLISDILLAILDPRIRYT